MTIAATTLPAPPIEPPSIAPDDTISNETLPQDAGMPAAAREYNQRWAVDERLLADASRIAVKFLVKETIGACDCSECRIGRRILSVPKRISDRSDSSITPIADEIVLLLADVAAELDRERKKKWDEADRRRQGSRRDLDDDIPF